MVLRGLAHVGVDTQTISRHYTYCYYNEEVQISYSRGTEEVEVTLPGRSRKASKGEDS